MVCVSVRTDDMYTVAGIRPTESSKRRSGDKAADDDRLSGDNG